MSWYREEDGTVVCCEDVAELVKSNISFQMGTVRRASDGKLVLIDEDLLWMCGKRKRRPAVRRDDVPRRTAYAEGLYRAIHKALKARVPDGCPADKGRCRFWNDAFEVCSLGGLVPKTEPDPPCRVREYE